MEIRAVVYARVSTDDQATNEKASIPEQIKWAKEEASLRGWTFVGEYIEPGVTGDTDISKRPKLSSLIEDSKQNKFDVVMAYYSSRIAREPDIGLKVCRLLGENKVQVFIRTHAVEITNPDEYFWGKNAMTVQAFSFAFAGDLKDNIERGDKTTLGSRRLAERGILRVAPYGYDKVPSFHTNELGRQVYSWHFEINPITSKVVKKIFKIYSTQGSSLRQIMLQLNKEDTPSPSGAVGLQAWSAATIKNILNNPAYIGKVRWGRKLGSKYKQGKSENGKTKRVIVPKEKWILEDGKNFEGFIDEKVWNAAQEKMKRRAEVKGRAIASNGLLTGLVYCAQCEKKAYYKARLTKKKNGRRYLRNDYICSTHIRHGVCVRYLIAGKKLDDIVIDEIAKLAKRYKKELESFSLPIDEEISNVESLQKLKTSIHRKQQRLTEAYESEALSLELYAERNKKLDADLLNIEEQIAADKKTISSQEKLNERRKKMVSLLENFKEEFSESDLQKRKDLLRGIIGRVVIDRRKGLHIGISFI